MIRSQSKPVVAVVGPTASGKSDLGIELASRFSGEIVNCDSVQVYRDLYVATAKVPTAERRGIPHHLIDIVDPTVNFTAGDFALAAATAIDKIEAHGHLALLVGGTGFYLRALLHGFFPGPPTDKELRARVRRLLDRRGPDHLHRLLRRIDPATAARLSPNDWSRTTRAIEVYFQTGSPISTHYHETPGSSEFAGRTIIFAIHPPRQALYDKINRRTDQMFATGLVEEVEALLASGVPPDAKALGAHGYRRVVSYLQGDLTLEQCIEQTKLDTRHYAKRQLTWWRNQASVRWLHGFGDDPEVIAAASEAL